LPEVLARYRDPRIVIEMKVNSGRAGGGDDRESCARAGAVERVLPRIIWFAGVARGGARARAGDRDERRA